MRLSGCWPVRGGFRRFAGLAGRFGAAVVALGAVAGCQLLPGPRPQATVLAPEVPPSVTALPPGLMEALGEGAAPAIARAQDEALAARIAGGEVAWQEGALRGRVTAGPLYSVNMRTCRELVHAAEEGRERLIDRMTMCVSSDGEWQPLGASTPRGPSAG